MDFTEYIIIESKRGFTGGLISGINFKIAGERYPAQTLQKLDK
ncbi:hypothetical protein [Chryseobacterium sp. FH2]|nr:hypothetical protein [Chryseobacterium sp. FH2]